MPPGKASGIVLVTLLLLAGVVAGRWLVTGTSEAPQLSQFDLESLNGPIRTSSNDGTWPVVVSNPDGPPRVPTGEVDSLGRDVTVSCVSCHANMTPNTERRSAEEPPMEFHRGLTYSHGALSCVSCHNPQNYNTLRLADGRSLAYSDLTHMCAQCHAPEARDWAHGSHGGMTGYWDLSRGGRLRKSCIDCHDPHAPAFPSMTPTFKPRDRFLYPAGGGGDAEDHDQ